MCELRTRVLGERKYSHATAHSSAKADFIFRCCFPAVETAGYYQPGAGLKHACPWEAWKTANRSEPARSWPGGAEGKVPLQILLCHFARVVSIYLILSLGRCGRASMESQLCPL